MPDITVKSIVRAYLEVNGYDGLHRGDACGCENADLIPCDCFCHDIGDCQPGYKQPCDCGDHDWHIGAEKPTQPKPYDELQYAAVVAEGLARVREDGLDGWP
jgi:hypothetical protein